jgi:glycosyltransferase involved in cell wall biosynthesis
VDAPAVDIVFPVHNEQRTLAASVRTLHAYLLDRADFTWQITIAQNASTDATAAIADELARELAAVAVLHLPASGRGRALRSAWASSRADVVAYMDIDLSTDLSALPDLLAPLLADHGDVAIGSRLVPGARVTRGLHREVISRSYNILLRALLGVTFADAQCGFKAGRREVIQGLLPEISDDGWFFDTELLYVAQRNRIAIREVPVRWVEDRDSRVAIVATALADLRGIARLRRRRSVPAPASAGSAAGTTSVGTPAAGMTSADAEVTHDHTLRARPQRRRERRPRPSPQLPGQSRLAV